jgi:hypothetical protein
VCFKFEALFSSHGHPGTNHAILALFLWFLALSRSFHVNSCKFVALWQNFVDRPESYDLNSAKSCIFLVHENMWAVLSLFPPLSNTICRIEQHEKNFPPICQITSSLYYYTLEIFSVVLISFEIQTVKIRVISLERQTCQQFQFPKVQSKFVKILAPESQLGPQ